MNENGPIIIFAGVFDPVHNGHLAAAQSASEQYGSKLVFLPEKMPWHKHGSTQYAHRLAMLRLAVADKPNIEVLDYPEEKQKIVETFSWLMHQYPGSEFIWLVGSDVVPHMHTWDGIGRLAEFQVSKIVVAERLDNPEIISGVDGLPATVTVVSMKTGFSTLNSSTIRTNVPALLENVPEPVRTYIIENRLYLAQ